MTRRSVSDVPLAEVHARAKRRPRRRPSLRGRAIVATLLLSLEAACRSAFVHAPALPSAPVLPEGKPAPALPGDDLDLLVWNIKKGERSTWRTEFETLARDKELVLLQEAYVAPRMTESLVGRPELQWLMGPSFAYAWRDGTPATGVAIGSAARALDQHAFVSTRTEPVAATPKAALTATYQLEGLPQPLLVVCIHAINFRSAEALTEQLRALEPVIRDHEGPVIFAGDLNTHHRARMEALEQFAAALDLRSAFENPDGSRPGTAASDARTRYRNWPLDHVYVRGLVIEHADVVDDVRGSDHKPLVLRLSLPASPGPRPALADAPTRDPAAG